MNTHPSISAVGKHMNDETEIAALAHRYYEADGRPEGKAQEHWSRAEEELRQQRAGGPPRSIEDAETEEEEIDQNRENQRRAETK